MHSYTYTDRLKPTGSIGVIQLFIILKKTYRVKIKMEQTVVLTLILTIRSYSHKCWMSYWSLVCPATLF